MRFSLPILLPALLLLLPALPAAANSRIGDLWSAPSAAAVGAFNSPLPGTIPTPRPPQPPAPPAAPTALPPAESLAEGQATIYRHRIDKVIGERSSPTIYAITANDALFRTDDNGRVWQQVRSVTPIDNFLMSSADPNVLYSGQGADCADPLAANQPFYRSQNGGLTWSELLTAINLRPLLIDPTNPNRLFAADCTMLYLSSDGGVTWQEQRDNSPAQLWGSYRVVAMSAASQVGAPSPASPHWDQIYAIGVDAQGTGVVAFSGDLGMTWANLTPSADPSACPAEGICAPLIDPRQIVAHPSQAGQVWVVSAQGIWTTTDFGVRWQPLNQGLIDFTDYASGAVHAVTQSPSGQLYLATSRGLYTQSAANPLWSKTGLPSFSSREVVGLLLTDSNPTMLWVNTAQAGTFVHRAE